MFNFLKKKAPPSTIHDLQSIKLKLNNLDCSSCAVDLDLTLEELPGVISVKTNYAKSTVDISFNSSQTTLDKIKSAIKKLGYIA